MIFLNEWDQNARIESPRACHKKCLNLSYISIRYVKDILEVV